MRASTAVWPLTCARSQPVVTVDARPARKLVEILALDELRAERRLLDRPGRSPSSASTRVDVLRRRRRARAENAPRGMPELAREDLVDRIELVHPAARHLVELVFLREVGLVLGDLDVHGAHATCP